MRLLLASVSPFVSRFSLGLKSEWKDILLKLVKSAWISLSWKLEPPKWRWVLGVNVSSIGSVCTHTSTSLHCSSKSAIAYSSLLKSERTSDMIDWKTSGLPTWSKGFLRLAFFAFKLWFSREGKSNSVSAVIGRSSSGLPRYACSFSWIFFAISISA